MSGGRDFVGRVECRYVKSRWILIIEAGGAALFDSE